jgi:hypothetical protein
MRICGPVLIVALLAGPAGEEPDLQALSGKIAREAELADQNRRSEALNVAVNHANAAVQARNDAARAAYEKALGDYAQARAAYETRVANQQAQAAAYAQALARWKLQVEACRARDLKGCAGAP